MDNFQDTNGCCDRWIILREDNIHLGQTFDDFRENYTIKGVELPYLRFISF